MAERKYLQELGSPRASYRPFESLELPESLRAGAFAVQCREGAFLLLRPEGWRFRDEAAGTEIAPGDGVTPTGELTGCHADLVLGPDLTVACDFEDEALVWAGERLPVCVSQVRPRLFLLAGEDPAFVLVLDAARGLVYGGAAGVPFGGYLDDPTPAE